MFQIPEPEFFHPEKLTLKEALSWGIVRFAIVWIIAFSALGIWWAL